MEEKSVEEIIGQNKLKIRNHPRHPGEVDHYATGADGETGMDVTYNHLTGEISSPGMPKPKMPGKPYGSRDQTLYCSADKNPCNFSKVSVRYSEKDTSRPYELGKSERLGDEQFCFGMAHGDSVIKRTFEQLSEERRSE